MSFTIGCVAPWFVWYTYLVKKSGNRVCIPCVMGFIVEEFCLYLAFALERYLEFLRVEHFVLGGHEQDIVRSNSQTILFWCRTDHCHVTYAIAQLLRRCGDVAKPKFEIRREIEAAEIDIARSVSEQTA